MDLSGLARKLPRKEQVFFALTLVLGVYLAVLATPSGGLNEEELRQEALSKAAASADNKTPEAIEQEIVAALKAPEIGVNSEWDWLQTIPGKLAPSETLPKQNRDPWVRKKEETLPMPPLELGLPPLPPTPSFQPRVGAIPRYEKQNKPLPPRKEVVVLDEGEGSSLFD